MPKGHDNIECPECYHMAKRVRVNRDKSERWQCVNPEWCTMTRFTITRDGDIANEVFEGNQ